MKFQGQISTGPRNALMSLTGGMEMTYVLCQRRPCCMWTIVTRTETNLALQVSISNDLDMPFDNESLSCLSRLPALFLGIVRVDFFY